MNEFDLIGRYFAREPVTAVSAAGTVRLGIGDDCALLQPPGPGQVLAVSSDLLIEGRHFFAGADPKALGHKSLAVNLSDLAAMGAVPLGFTLSIALPAIDEAWLQSFSDGLFDLSRRFDCPLVGGDTTRGPLAISITIFGSVAEGVALRRDRARVGDGIWVSGPLGGAAFAVAQRKSGADADAGAARRLDWPEPRLALGRRLLGLAHAAIDLSDGLSGDLSHLLRASSRASGEALGATLMEADVPFDPSLTDLSAPVAWHHVLHGGDDYELLFTAPASADAAIRALGVAGTVSAHPGGGGIEVDGVTVESLTMPRLIGRIGSGRGILLVDRDGGSSTVIEQGFDHFRE